MATHYTNALPCATLPNLTTNGFRITEPVSQTPAAVPPTQTQAEFEAEAEPLPVIDKDEICPRFMGGCGNKDSTLSCGCRENLDGRLFQVDELEEMFRTYANQAKTQIQTYHLDVFVGGLLIGTNLPKIGWMMLSYAATFPVLIAFQHPDAFIQLYKKKPEYFIVLISGLIACQAYALYCIRNLIF